MTKIICAMIMLFTAAIVAHGESRMTAKAKAAFAFAMFNPNCTCQNCNCVDCKCTNSQCDCTNYDAIYSQSVKNNQVIVLAVGGIDLTNTPYRVIKLKSIQGERPGYIVGVPKNGKLVRLDFPVTASRERIRLDILHVLYPLTNGYVECPTCPQGRIKGSR